MLLKIDLCKAYNSLEWDFLYLSLKAWGFSEKFQKLIMSCVSLVHYSLLLNGSINNNFKPSCGLCQGDLLSPFLFIICTEFFSSMMVAVEGSGQL